jgi:hypothetical protein
LGGLVLLAGFAAWWTRRWIRTLKASTANDHQRDGAPFDKEVELAIVPVDADEIPAANLDSSEVSGGRVLTEAPRVAIERPGGRVLIDVLEGGF